LQTLLRRQRVSSNYIDNEIQFYLDQQIAENIAAGMSRKDADGRSSSLSFLEY